MVCSTLPPKSKKRSSPRRPNPQTIFPALSRPERRRSPPLLRIQQPAKLQAVKGSWKLRTTMQKGRERRRRKSSNEMPGLTLIPLFLFTAAIHESFYFTSAMARSLEYPNPAQLSEVGLLGTLQRSGRRDDMKHTTCDMRLIWAWQTCTSTNSEADRKIATRYQDWNMLSSRGILLNLVAIDLCMARTGFWIQ